MFLKNLLTTFFIALSLSVDDLAVGTAYGLQKILIPLKPLFLMVLGSTITMAVTMILGKLVLSFIGTTITTYLSATLLAALGCYYLYKAWREKNTCKIKSKNYKEKARTVVNGREAFFLGAALGIDDFAEAIGLSIAGFPVILTVILFKIAEVIMVLSGVYFGFKGLSRFINEKLAYVPGIVLVLVGLWQLK